MTELRIRRGPAHEDENGDLLFECRIPAAHKAAFFAAWPTLEMVIRGAEEALPESPRLPVASEAIPEPLEIGITGVDSLVTGRSPEAVRQMEFQRELVAILGLPTFQNWALTAAKLSYGEIPDSLEFAAHFMQERTGKPLRGITEADAAPILEAFRAWTQAQGRE